jgi:hypothetical protein
MTLISIIGDFHSSILPISYNFKEQIRKHIIVYDDAKCDMTNAQRIIAGQRAFISHCAVCDYEVLEYKIEEDSYESIVACLEFAITEAKGIENLYLNSTDGLSSVAIVLASKLLHAGANVLAYDRFANTYNLHTCDGIKKEAITESMDISTHLQLKGYTLLDYTHPNVLARRKVAVKALCKNLREFKAFTTQLQHTPIDTIEGYTTYKEILKSIGQYKEVTFIQGTVFEEYIYHLIVEHFDFDDVMTGVRIEVEEGVQNELDILMIKDNHLHTIECKLVNGLDGEHFVYKTDLVMEYLDDDGKAMILSIGGKNIRTMKSGKKRTQFTKGDQARAKYGRINIYQQEVFDEERFLASVREWFFG